ncbi:MAG: sporulation integral membrane protein YtvI [Clostridia bacterium]|nr:sporulation integral membrane protein YtvI [Clostridia bacterium]
MDKQWEKWQVLAHKLLIVGVLGGAAVLLLFLLPRALILFLPFIIAFFISCIAGPVYRLMRRAHFPRQLGALLSVVLVIAVVGGILTAIVFKIATETVSFAQNFSSIYSTAAVYIEGALVDLREWIRLLPEGAVTGINNFLINAVDQFGEIINTVFSNLVTAISTGALNAAKNVPSLLVAFIVTILASYFMLSDGIKISAFFRRTIGDDAYANAVGVKNDLFAALGGYVRAQLILMSITFCELLVGFLILRVDYAFLLALLIAFIDAIPILGTGTVLLPWALVQLLMQNYAFALGLLILYGVCLAVRQLLEPKIVSTQIGVHPLVTLISMYIGLRLFGFLGMILGPIIVLIVKNLLIRLRKNKPAQ